MQSDWNVVRRGYYAHFLGEAEHNFADPVAGVQQLMVGGHRVGGRLGGSAVDSGWQGAPRALPEAYRGEGRLGAPRALPEAYRVHICRLTAARMLRAEQGAGLLMSPARHSSQACGEQRISAPPPHGITKLLAWQAHCMLCMLCTLCAGRRAQHGV